jgi:PAS domain S-box-containing protein
MRRHAVQDQFGLPSLTQPNMLSRINKLKIAPRLILSFAVIVLLMLVGNSLLLWQFRLVRQQSDRVSALARELVVVSRFQTDILSLDAKLDSLAKSEDIDGLKRESGRLRSVLLTDTDAVRDALIRLPSDLPRDTAILPTVEAVEITLPPQLDAVIALGAASDWNTARLRLANEKKPLEASASDLVRSVEQEVSDQLSRSVAQAERVQSRILLILLLTAFVTLLMSAILGFAITHSISAPLRQLLQGSTALARGDFDHQVQLSGHDELAHLGTVFNETTAKLRELYRQIQSSQAYLAEAQRLSHLGSWAWKVAGREVLHLSDEWYRIYGFDPKQGIPAWQEPLQRIHPEDRGTWEGAIEGAIRERSDYNLEFRIVLPDGTLKWVHTVGNPVFSAAGELVQFVGSSMDVTNRKRSEDELKAAFEEIKQLKDQLYRENLALRDEVNRAATFEEIVGTSKPLKAVLFQTAKVAPTDSTVLITGETGTGKELIARMVHKRSERAEHAFISVNCAAFAPTLISSELFGHEKGAFTGATQRRPGRFELADGGTIFLDEVGELPPDTQVALLRVLQEREFERVGGTQPIKVDVRVIAATNRDLNAAVSGGSFRSDLFYRLQVFPIEIPPLRERRDDIPLLVEYFIDRYARKAGKNIRHVSQETLELLRSYAWPGNIRELQNVIERSVILCETQTFSIDESWLPQQPQPFLIAKPENQIELPRRLEAQAKNIIEDALKASRGSIFGPEGAAAKLGIPRSTLESKIKSLKIDKNRFRTLSEI